MSPSLSKSPNAHPRDSHRNRNPRPALPWTHLQIFRSANCDTAICAARNPLPCVNCSTSGYTCPLQIKMSAHPSLSMSKNPQPHPRYCVCFPSPAGKVASSKFPPPIFRYKRRRISRKICFHDIQVAVQIVINRRNAHPRLRFAVRAQCAARFHRHIRKFSVAQIFVQRARGRIIGHINIRPAIIIKIRRQHAQPIRSIRRQNSRRFCETSLNVPSPLLWYRIFFPPFSPGGPHATSIPL